MRRGCSVRPPRRLAGSMNRGRINSQSALLAAVLPGKSLLLSRRRLPGHGLARPPERRGRDREAGSCPSFLPFFEIKILSSGRSTGSSSGGLCCQPLQATLGSAAHVGFRRRDPARRHFSATAAQAGTLERTAAPGTSPTSRSLEAAPAAAAGPRVWPRCRGRAESEPGGSLH